jgi:hypothetical protein
MPQAGGHRVKPDDVCSKTEPVVQLRGKRVEPRLFFACGWQYVSELDHVRRGELRQVDPDEFLGYAGGLADVIADPG